MMQATPNQSQSSSLGRTYFDVLRNGNQVEYEIYPIKIGNRFKISIPKEVTKKTIQYWDNNLVGRFSGLRLGLDIIREWIRNKWKTKNLVQVMAMPKGYVLFRFANQEDLIPILLKSPWIFTRKAMSLEKWHPDFNPGIPMIK